MKLYIAGKWQERERIHELMNYAVLRGHAITHDWTTNKEMSVEHAALDIKGVQNCHALIVIADKELNYKGVYVEMGIALGLSRKVYVLGTGLDSCVFTKACTKITDLDEIL